MFSKLGIKVAQVTGVASMAAGLLLAGAGGAQAASGSACPEYSVDNVNTVAKVCRTWKDNGNGSFDGTWNTTWYVNGGGDYKTWVLRAKFMQDGQWRTDLWANSGTYKNRSNLSIQICRIDAGSRETCSSYK
jgi:hypothetical protein